MPMCQCRFMDGKKSTTVGQKIYNGKRFMCAMKEHTLCLLLGFAMNLNSKKFKCIHLKINEIQVRHIMKQIKIMKLTLPNKCTSFVCYS